MVTPGRVPRLCARSEDIGSYAGSDGTGDEDTELCPAMVRSAIERNGGRSSVAATCAGAGRKTKVDRDTRSATILFDRTSQHIRSQFRVLVASAVQSSIGTYILRPRAKPWYRTGCRDRPWSCAPHPHKSQRHSIGHHSFRSHFAPYQDTVPCPRHQCRPIQHRNLYPQTSSEAVVRDRVSQSLGAPRAARHQRERASASEKQAIWLQTSTSSGHTDHIYDHTEMLYHCTFVLASYHHGIPSPTIIWTAAADSRLSAGQPDGLLMSSQGGPAS